VPSTAVVRRIGHRGEEAPVEHDAADSASHSYLLRDPIGISAKTTASVRAHVRAGADERALEIGDQIRRLRMPTERRTRFGGDANSAAAVEACVIRAGTSISDAAERLGELEQLRPRTNASALLRRRARNETMPPKSHLTRCDCVAGGREAG
jgi:hypothetical protein